MNYQKNFHPVQKTVEKGGGRKLVNTAGYIPAKDQIENMILAGERLSAYRQELYFQEDQKENPFDLQVNPASRRDFDIIDAKMGLDAVQAKADQLRKETHAAYIESQKKLNEPQKVPDKPAE